MPCGFGEGGLDVGGSTISMVHETLGGAVVVHVSGEIDLLTVRDFQAGLDRACAEARPPTVVVADLAEVTFLGSTGLAVLMDVDKRCREQRTPLRVVATGPGVVRPLEVTGLDRILTIDESLDSVIRSA